MPERTAVGREHGILPTRRLMPLTVSRLAVLRRRRRSTAASCRVERVTAKCAQDQFA
jgi:hypothetical protein